MEEIDKLRPVSNQKAENLKQNSDYEFLDGIFSDDSYSWLKGSNNII
jgi:hypothetical protein